MTRILKLVAKLGLVGVLTIACIPVLWILLTAFFEPQLVLFQAKRIAGDRPYCIAVPDKEPPFEYKEVKSHVELSYSNLTTHLWWGGSSGPFAQSYYAILVLRQPDDVWNWSKRFLDFRDDVNLLQFSMYKRNFTTFCHAVVGFGSRVD